MCAINKPLQPKCVRENGSKVGPGLALTKGAAVSACAQLFPPPHAPPDHGFNNASIYTADSGRYDYLR